MDKDDMKSVNTDSYSPDWVLHVKSSIRPVLTYVFTLLYLYVFIKRSDMSDVYIGGLNTIMITIIIFWFGERLLRNTGMVDMIKNIVTPKK